MESMLFKLFDFQRFDGNGDLQAVIDDVDSRYGQKQIKGRPIKLSDSMLELVSAAGSGTPKKTGEGI